MNSEVRSPQLFVEKLIPSAVRRLLFGQRQQVLPELGPPADLDNKGDNDQRQEALEELVRDSDQDFRVRNVITGLLDERAEHESLEEWTEAMAQSLESRGFMARRSSTVQLRTALAVAVNEPSLENLNGLVSNLDKRQIRRDYDRASRVVGQSGGSGQNLEWVGRGAVPQTEVGGIREGAREQREMEKRRVFLVTGVGLKLITENGERELMRRIGKLPQSREVGPRVLKAIEQLSGGDPKDLITKYKDQIKDGTWDGYRAVHFTPSSVLLLFRFENGDLYITIGDHQNLYHDNKRR